MDTVKMHPLYAQVSISIHMHTLSQSEHMLCYKVVVSVNKERLD